MSNEESSNSPQIKLIEEWGKGFGLKDLNILAKSLHKEFRHITYPQSLGVPEKNKDQWLEQLSEVFSVWTTTEVSYLSCRSNLLHCR